MNLYCTCPNCSSEVRFNSDAHTRVDLKMKHGGTYEVRCRHCEQTQAIPINKIIAKPSKALSIIAGLVFLVGAIIVIYYVRKMILDSNSAMGIYAVATGFVIPLGIYLNLTKQDMMRVRTFNNSKVNDHSN